MKSSFVPKCDFEFEAKHNTHPKNETVYSPKKIIKGFESEERIDNFPEQQSILDYTIQSGVKIKPESKQDPKEITIVSHASGDQQKIEFWQVSVN